MTSDRQSLPVFLARPRNQDNLRFRPAVAKIRELLFSLKMTPLFAKEDLQRAKVILSTSPGALEKCVKRAKGTGMKAILLSFAHQGFLDVSHKKGTVSLSNLKAHEKADLILVSTKGEKAFLEEEGVTTPIRVVPIVLPHDFKAECPQTEKPAVLRHYRLADNRPFVALMGDLYDKAETDQVRGLARILPETQFLMFGTYPKGSKAKSLQRKCKETNLRFVDELRPEFYRSLLASIQAFIALDPNQADPYILMDAIASSIPVIGPSFRFLSDLFVPDTDYQKSKVKTLELYNALKGALGETEENREMLANAKKRLLAKANDRSDLTMAKTLKEEALA